MDNDRVLPSRIIITAAMNDSGINQKQLAELIGMKNQSNVSEALKRDMKVSLFIKMLDAMGYEIIVQKKAVPLKVELPIKIRT